MSWYQQGDVLIKPIKQLPRTARRLEAPVLADGEATGHQHVAVGQDVAVLESAQMRLLKAPRGARITHPEHKPIELPPGNYEVSKAREYDPFTREAGRVAD